MSAARVLAVVSNHREQAGVRTGFWLSELAYPYHHLTRRGVVIEVASPGGGEVAFSPFSDPRNEHGAEVGDLVALGFLSWQPAVAAMKESVPLAAVDPDAYATCWVVSGVGPTFDLVEDVQLQRVQSAMWASGKPLAAICHGVVSLASVIVGGVPLVAGQAVTGYSKDEDLEVEGMLGFRLTPVYVEDALRAAGADYRAAAPHTPCVVRGADGRLVTGQNSESADEFGRALAQLVAG